MYILECRGGKLYAGITTDVGRRFSTHSRGKGAAYTRMNPPVRVLGALPFETRSEATRAEAALKRMPRVEKLRWVREHPWPSPTGPRAPDRETSMQHRPGEGEEERP